LSSAILYVAIVAIWAGVLIPRWLRRDSSVGDQVSDETTTTDTPADEGRPAPPRQRNDDVPAARRNGRPGVPQAQARPARSEEGRSEESRDEGRSDEGRSDEGRSEDAPQRQEHARVLSARRRLLGLLLVLTIGSGALAVTRMAAWWVIVPSSIMLLGYLALLTEAAKADAERRGRASARAADRAAPAAPAAPPEPVPGAEIIKLAAAQGSTGQADEKFYDQYADAKLRAVGDLAHLLVSLSGPACRAGRVMLMMSPGHVAVTW